MAKQFEYNVLNIVTLSSDHLNELGKDGWQVCHIEKTESTMHKSGYQITIMREADSDPLQMLSKMLGAFNVPKD